MNWFHEVGAHRCTGVALKPLPSCGGRSSHVPPAVLLFFTSSGNHSVSRHAATGSRVNEGCTRRSCRRARSPRRCSRSGTGSSRRRSRRRAAGAQGVPSIATSICVCPRPGGSRTRSPRRRTRRGSSCSAERPTTGPGMLPRAWGPQKPLERGEVLCQTPRGGDLGRGPCGPHHPG